MMTLAPKRLKARAVSLPIPETIQMFLINELVSNIEFRIINIVFAQIHSFHGINFLEIRWDALKFHVNIQENFCISM